MKTKPLLTLLTASAVLAAPLITGKILRPDGSPIANVIVQLKSTLEKDTTDAAGVYAIGIAPSSSSAPVSSQSVSFSLQSSSSIAASSAGLSSSSVLSSSSNGTVALAPVLSWDLHQSGDQIQLNLGSNTRVFAAVFSANGSLIKVLSSGILAAGETKWSLPRIEGVQYLKLDLKGHRSVYQLVNGQLESNSITYSTPKTENAALGLAANDSLILWNGSTRMFAVGVSAGVSTIPNIYAVNRVINGSYTGGTPSRLQLSMNTSVQNRLYDIVFGSSPFSLSTWSEWLPGTSWTGQIFAYNTANQVVGSSGILNFTDSTSKLSFSGFVVSSSSTVSSSSVLSSSSVISSSSTLSSSSILSSSSAVSYGSLYDTRDGKTYKTVQIGTQEWMAQNLNYGTKVLGASIQSNSSQIEKYCYSDSDANCTTYGGLYQWAEMMNLPSSCNSTNCSSQVDALHQGICPVGWHIPIDAEWDYLNTLIGEATAGTQLKSTTGWSGTPGNGSDHYGFSALSAGYLDSFNRLFVNLGTTTYFWSASEWQVVTSGTTPYGLSGSNTTFNPQAGVGKEFGFSVRCIKNIASTSSSSSFISSSSNFSSSSVLSSSSVALSSSVTLSSSVLSSSSALSYSSLYDTRDGKTYKTIQIGTQEWMAENLNYKPTTGVSYCYANVVLDCAKYGRLYDWATAMNGAASSNATPSGVQGICPSGWHLPSDNEWKTLYTYVSLNNGSDSFGKSLRVGDASYNQFGFSALLNGMYSASDKGFYSLNTYAYFWTSTDDYYAFHAYNRNIRFDDESFKEMRSKYDALSVRCLKD